MIPINEKKLIQLKKERGVAGEYVYDIIKGMILGWDLAPGQKININSLSKEINISPIPLREALSRLHSEKLVGFEPNKGYRVSDILDDKSMSDLLEARLLIELYAIRTVIQFNRLYILEELRELNEQLSSPKESVFQEEFLEFSNLDRAFHLTIIRAADNPFLLEAYEGMHIHFHQARFYHIRGGIDRHEGVEEHLEIIESIQTRDVYRAELAVTNHIKGAKNRLLVKKNL